MSWTDDLQREHKEWLDREYPKQEPWLPASGLVEEAGELLQCEVRRRREEVYGQEPRHARVDLRAKLLDAVGDCFIYACSFCNCDCIRWKLSDVYARSDDMTPDLEDELELVLRLVQDGVDMTDPPYMVGSLAAYVATLRAFCTAMDIELRQAAEAAWSEVAKRRHA